MRELAAMSIGALVIVITAKLGMHAAILICMSVAIFIAICWPWIQWYLHLRKLDRYAKQYENIYEFSNDPNDREVYRRAERHRQLLDESGNIVDPPVQVYEIYFQDSDNLDEDWETFTTRVEKFIQEDREKRHSLKGLNKDREWYKANKLKQVGVLWRKNDEL